MAWTGAAQQANLREPRPGKTVPYVTSEDGTRLFVDDWGAGRPILFLSAWTLQSNVWGSHIATLTDRGFRCVALDRRGHGRSEAPSYGYDLNTLADDVGAVIEQKNLKDVTLVAHSMGSAEAVRYCARHGMDRATRLMLAAPVTPSPMQGPDNPREYRSRQFKRKGMLSPRAFQRGSPRMKHRSSHPRLTPRLDAGLRT